MTPYTTTPRDFSQFKQEVKRMLDVLGLMDWSVTITHEPIAEPVNAQIRCNHPGKLAQITLNTTAAAENFDAQRCARHEVFELLLAPLVHAAESRVTYPDEIEGAIHSIIRRLEHVDRMTRSFYPNTACVRCGSELGSDMLCRDLTCPFSDVPQYDPRGWAGHPQPPDGVDAADDLEARQGRSC